jgi:hypothetical protein
MQNVTQLRDYRSQPNARIFFDRKELDAILNVYGIMVAKGEWRDYAMGDDKEQAVFAIFRRASEMPVYRIIKCPKLAKKQGAYAIIGVSGQILKRGQDLKVVLRYFDKKKFSVIG